MGRAEDLFQRLIDQGEQAIDNFILDRQSEELFLDFKRSSNNGKGRTLHQDDRKNLAKAISGFGNSEGGVVVWGVDCRNLKDSGDVAGAKVPIHNPKRFKSWLEGAVSGCNVPPHSGVKNEAIEQTSKSTGFVVTLIPKSELAPHQCLKPLRYYIRAGSDFVPTPHAVLAGMFGRRPTPSLSHNWTIEPENISAGKTLEFNLFLNIKNRSPVIARDLYVNTKIIDPGKPSEIGVSLTNYKEWSVRQDIGLINSNFISFESFKLAPESSVEPIIIHFKFGPPFQSGFSYNISFGCHGSSINVLEYEINKYDLKVAFETYLENNNNLENIEMFIKKVMGISETNEIEKKKRKIPFSKQFRFSKVSQKKDPKNPFEIDLGSNPFR